ncbi:Helix-turn-helix domain-containing protein [Streptomyces sp. TLI_053]|uniref:helix-turn-helix domain-containing protein n=1 Tax=Streptomyces sp. TLI_053 TaxID=1855352 RepID=UPI00087A5922|nr:helix-turn-helix transcriptional regulator [Streptomyces sp. TLI_053]SDT49955.1 Helix-turn-helix domain-containing protein [Streptomyces sp. TLI_053]
MSSGYHTRWVVPPEHRETEEYRAAGRRMALAEAVHTRRSVLGWTAAELAERAGLDEAIVESIEESGVDPTLPLIERLAAAFDSAVRIDPSGDPAIRFEAHAA